MNDDTTLSLNHWWENDVTYPGHRHYIAVNNGTYFVLFNLVETHTVIGGHSNVVDQHPDLYTSQLGPQLGIDGLIFGKIDYNCLNFDCRVY